MSNYCYSDSPTCASHLLETAWDLQRGEGFRSAVLDEGPDGVQVQLAPSMHHQQLLVWRHRQASMPEAFQLAGAHVLPLRDANLPAMMAQEASYL